MVRRLTLPMIATLLAACAAPTLLPTPAPTIFVRTFDGGTCPLAGLPPGPITIRIDPSAPWPDHVVGIDAIGEPHPIWWPEGFMSGVDGEPVVIAVSGAVVAWDGDVIQERAQGFPRLNGYAVCSGSDMLYVQLSLPPG